MRPGPLPLLVLLALGVLAAGAAAQAPALIGPTGHNPYRELLPLPPPAPPGPPPGPSAAAEPAAADALPPPGESVPPAPAETAPAVVQPAVAQPAVAQPDVAQPAVAQPPAAEALGPVVEAELAPDIAAAPTVEEPILHWYQPAYWFGPTPWDSGIEFGLNGSSGTSESLSFRGGGFMKRKADDYKFDASLYYNKTHSNGVEVQSNALLDTRYDWLFDDSPWTLFVMSQTFYDEFQAFDVNFNVNTGFGYTWFDEEWTKLTTSMGTGASREFGGPGSEWVQEASFSVNYELKFADNHRFYAKADYFPEWESFGNYRVLADTGLQFSLHEPSNLSLKLSATDRYDSDPQGVAPHNLNYSALLIWKL
ncbi:DUF481 domain-containing protein [Botrimarina sp.]|uniref:DUF481 domain-containing protein n=1 Tax=Botrimarina sp. TaxID=2795802 RepID=UPI0032EF5EB6